MAQHTARKRFGQNFLVDLSVIDQILRAIDPQPNDVIVEIGPGLGALTKPLLQRVKPLHVIEIDRDLASRLRRQYDEHTLDVIEHDALTVDLSALARERGQSIRLVGNLPYNISSPLLFACADHADHVVDQHFMLQKEVVDRMVAQPGSRDFSRLTVMLQYRYEIEKLLDVMPESFDPPPRVTSSVVRLVPRPSSRVRAQDEALFAQLVLKAFAQRRKMLRGALGQWAQHMPWEEVGVDPTWRAEQVSVQGYVLMADALSQRTKE